MLPVTAVVVLTAWVIPSFRASSARHDRTMSARRPSRTVLVTGVNMSKGLATARMFHRRGHRVIGADCANLSPAIVSSAIDRFYILPLSKHTHTPEDDPYIRRLLLIAEEQQVDLWLSVSDVNAAVQDGQARDILQRHTKTRCIQLSQENVELLHNKARFMEHAQLLGLTVPTHRTVYDQTSLTQFLVDMGGLALNSKVKRRFIVKPVGVDDLARFNMAMLPHNSKQETVEAVKSIPFHNEKNLGFLAQEYIDGAEFCTHALVIRGQVRAFVACRSSSVLMHYSALPVQSSLGQSMLAFTKAIAAHGGDDWTGHISFDFMVKESEGAGEESLVLYPIECNPRVHTAVLLFNNTPEIVDEYLSVLEPDLQPLEKPLYPRTPRSYYWLGQDLVEQVFCPLSDLFCLGSLDTLQYLQKLSDFFCRVWTWKDGTFENWDPWPFWWLYHVYWPLQLVQYLGRKRWHKINVSTGKIFQAS